MEFMPNFSLIRGRKLSSIEFLLNANLKFIFLLVVLLFVSSKAISQMYNLPSSVATGSTFRFIVDHPTLRPKYGTKIFSPRPADPAIYPNRYYWDHSFGSPGTYLICLVASTGDPCESGIGAGTAQTIIVANPVGPVTVTSSGSTAMCVISGQASASTYTASSTNADGFSWSVTPSTAGNVVFNNSTGSSITVNWTSTFASLSPVVIRATALNILTFTTYSEINVYRRATTTFQPGEITFPLGNSVCAVNGSIGFAVRSYQPGSGNENHIAKFEWNIVDDGTIRYTSLGVNSSTYLPPTPADVSDLNAVSVRVVITPDPSVLCLTSYGNVTKQSYPVPIGTFLNANQYTVIPAVTVSAVTWDGLSTGALANHRCQGSGTSQFSAYANNGNTPTWTMWDFTANPAATTTTAGSISSTGLVTWNSNFVGQARIIFTANGCGGSTDFSSRDIVIDPRPNIVISPSGTLRLGANTTQLITGSTGAGYSYQWKKNGIEITDATTNTFAATVAGIYTMVVTLNSCIIESASLNLTTNLVPIANAGLDQSLLLPTNGTVLSGVGSDQDGTIAAYTWRKINGPVATLANSTTANLTLSNLVIGEYVFGLVVRDDFGASSEEDQIVVYVSPANGLNWIKQTTVLVSNKILPTDVESAQIQNGEKSVNWGYFDGLGRSVQSVVPQASPNNKLDIVQPIVYDVFNREVKKYLPFVAGNNGSYKPNPIDPVTGNYINAAVGFYGNGSTDKIVDDTRYFSETVFEPSPLNRPLRQYGPGEGWKNQSLNIDKFTEHQYLVNGTSEVYSFNYNSATGLVALAAGAAGYYASGVLFVNKTVDENLNEVIEFVDKEGRTVCKKVQVSGSGASKVYASTYYIYDDLGNLSVVLPPEAVTRFTQP